MRTGPSHPNHHAFARGHAWFVNRLSSRWTQAMIAVLRDAARYATDGEGFPAGKVHVIHNAVERSLQPAERAVARRRLGLPADGCLVVTVAEIVASSVLITGADASTVMDSCTEPGAREKSLRTI